MLSNVSVFLCLTDSPTNLHWAEACLFYLLEYLQDSTTGPGTSYVFRDTSLSERLKQSTKYQAVNQAKLYEGSEESGIPKLVGQRRLQ